MVKFPASLPFHNVAKLPVLLIPVLFLNAPNIGPIKPFDLIVPANKQFVGHTGCERIRPTIPPA